MSASCCWNGLVVLDPSAFQEGALRFRAARPGPAQGQREFVDSEINLLCRDLRRLKGGGGLAVVVDPAVRVAYSQEAHRSEQRINWLEVENG